MEKYKVCPTCGTKNPPTMMECVSCETDLTSVPIGEIITAPEPAQDEAPSGEQGTAKMVRICECGTKDLASARKCSACGEDISDIMPTPDTCAEAETTPGQRYFFSSLDGQYSYEFTSNLTVIGRENAMREYLATKSYVSRRHGEILLEANKLWIKGYANTNHTYVNNALIKDDEYFELHDGDTLGLGGKEINGSMQVQAAYFRVRIGSCT